MKNTIALAAESYFLFYIHPSIDIDIIALYADSLIRYVPEQENVTRWLVIFNLL